MNLWMCIMYAAYRFLYDDSFTRVNMTWLVVPSLDICFCFDLFVFFSLSFVLMRFFSVSPKMFYLLKWVCRESMFILLGYTWMLIGFIVCQLILALRATTDIYFFVLFALSSLWRTFSFFGMSINKLFQPVRSAKPCDTLPETTS